DSAGGSPHSGLPPGWERRWRARVCVRVNSSPSSPPSLLSSKDRIPWLVEGVPRDTGRSHLRAYRRRDCWPWEVSLRGSAPHPHLCFHSPALRRDGEWLSLPDFPNHTMSAPTEPFLQSLFAERIGGRRYGQGTAIYKFEKIKRAKAAARLAQPDR